MNLNNTLWTAICYSGSVLKNKDHRIPWQKNHLYSMQIFQYFSQLFYVHKCVHKISKELYDSLVLLTKNNGERFGTAFCQFRSRQTEAKTHIKGACNEEKTHGKAFYWMFYDYNFCPGILLLQAISFVLGMKKKFLKKMCLVMLQVKRWITLCLFYLKNIFMKEQNHWKVTKLTTSSFSIVSATCKYLCKQTVLLCFRVPLMTK